MAHNVEIKGVRYVPSSEAASVVGYTSDYVARLAREGQVRATRVGRQWFVDPKSLEQFYLFAYRQKEARRKHLKEQRAAERRAVVHERPASVSPRVVEVHERATVPRAIVRSLTVTSAGFFVGALLAYTPVHVGSSFSAFAERGIENLAVVAVSFHRSIDDFSRVVVGGAGESGQEAGVQYTPDDGEEVQGVENGLVIIPEDADATEQIESIRQSFSDEVVITRDEDDPQTGMITPIFRDRTGETYRFLMVPVAEGSEP